MTYSFNMYGWFVKNVEIPGRTTDVEPPECGDEPVVGEPWPNWSGADWTTETYREPPLQLPPEPAIPQSVTMRQARLALLAAGKLSAVDAAINALSSPQKEAARIEWEYSGEVFRDRPLIQMLAPALNLSDSDIDALFIQAAQL